jgi:hypothetical protein
MPLIIKPEQKGSSVSSECNIRRIAAMMINMETNQHFYDDCGKVAYADSPDVKRPAFNTYVHKSVDFEFTLAFGVVLIYTPEFLYNFNFVELIKTQLQIMEMPSNFTEHVNEMSDNYTMVKSRVKNFDTTTRQHSRPRDTQYRKIIPDQHDVKRTVSTNHQFSWLIIVKSSSNFRGSTLSVQEMDPIIPSEIYLNRSVGTIIFDNLDMFNIPNMTKQLDYPYLHQYNIYRKKRIIVEPIHICWTGGLRYELNYLFTGTAQIHTNYNPLIRWNIELGEPILPNMLYLKRLNPDLEWTTQLKDTFDYKQQEEDEVNLCEEGKHPFLNDVCFITKIPLWGKFYVIKIANENCEFQIAVVPSAFHSLHMKGTISFDIIELINQCGVTVTSVSVSECSKTFMEVLDSVPNLNPVKKNIMKCMELYGCYSRVDQSGGSYRNYSSNVTNSNRTYYTMDKHTKQIYVGITHIKDLHMFMYAENAILFRVILVNHGADPILFSGWVDSKSE